MDGERTRREGLDARGVVSDRWRGVVEISPPSNLKKIPTTAALEELEARGGRCKTRPTVAECCCSESWVDFTQSTSLHGLKYIWLPHTFAARRFMWLMLTVTCVSVMSYQVLERVFHYYSWPVNVNVRVNYNKTLLFPTLTLCNQNAFRASRAAELNYYELLTSMYTDPFSSSDLARYNATSLRMTDLYKLTAHSREDLIVGCKWKSEECGPDNFTEVLTDHGLCYTFNLPQHQRDALCVTSPGAENGLTLTLNVEQYEYMPGPHDAAGVKILIHDYKQIPKVNELGIALPTGSHSFIGLELITVENLGRPHGECDSPLLHYFPEYSQENCQMEYFTSILKTRCGCRLYFMPSIDGDVELCSLTRHYDCYQLHAEEIRSALRTDCQCPVPCHFHIFDPTVSYATTSTFVIDRFLSNTNRSALKMKYKNARDVTNRHQNNKVELLETLLLKLKEKFEFVKDKVFFIKNEVEEQRKTLRRVSERELWNWKLTYTYFRYQNYILQKNLVRARDAMDERTFSILAHGVQQFTFSVETKIKQLVDRRLNDSSVRHVIHLMTKNQLNARLDIARRTRQNYTQLITGFLNASSIFNYKFRNFRRNESNLILPRELLSAALTQSDSVRKRTMQVEKDIISMAYWMKEYGRLAAVAFNNHTLNHTSLHITNVQFLRTSREYLQSRSMFFDDFIQWPVLQLDAREEGFFVLKRKLLETRDNMFGYLDSIAQLIVDIQTSLLINLFAGLNMCENYLQYGNISKLEVAEFVISERVQIGVNSLRLFAETLRRRCEDVHDSWNELTSITQDIWNYTLGQKDLMRYWSYKNLTRYLRDYNLVAEEVSHEYTGYRTMIDSSCQFHSLDEEFLQSFDWLTEHMREFYQSSHVDAAFVRDNFLKVDIFYRELNYEKITQQKAYDVFALLCDIGGSMGLFIGASVMTVFEILDLIIYRTVTPARSSLDLQLT